MPTPECLELLARAFFFMALNYANILFAVVEARMVDVLVSVFRDDVATLFVAHPHLEQTANYNSLRVICGDLLAYILFRFVECGRFNHGTAVNVVYEYDD